MTEETGEVESPQEEPVAGIEDVSTDQLREMMETDPIEAEQPEELETEATEPVPEEETEAERHAKRRIRPRSALDQQVLDLYKSDAFDGSFADASKVIYGQEEQNTLQDSGPTEAAKKPDPTAYYDHQVSQLQQEILSLESQVTEAADNLETADALKLQREITRRELKVQTLTNSKDTEIQRIRDTEYNTHRDKALESRDRALEANPELQDTEALPRKQFDEYVRQAQQNPDYTAIFESPLWPEFMVREYNAMAQVHQQQAEVQAPPQTAPAMGTQAKVLTTGSTEQPVNAPLTPEQLASNMGQLSNEQLYALLGQDDRQPMR